MIKFLLSDTHVGLVGQWFTALQLARLFGIFFIVPTSGAILPSKITPNYFFSGKPNGRRWG